MKLTINLVVWNGAKYIPYLFDSLRKQTFRDWQILIWDNYSEDKTVELIKNELQNFSFPYEIFENNINYGFAGGHNELFKKCQTNYFLLLNQDMYLEPDCLERLVSFLDKQPEVASVSPRLMRWLFSEVEAERIDNSFSPYIDSLGLKVFRNRRVVDWLAQNEWPLKFENITNKEYVEVFGVSGAMPMYRRGAIEEVKFDDGNFFDQLYHLYKEDVDLAWRLQQNGKKSYVILDAVAFHDRSGAGLLDSGDWVAGKNKRKQSQWVRYYSYKNHLITLIKNEYTENFWLDLPWILWYELKKFGWFVIYDRPILKGLGEIWNNRKEIREKRKKIKQTRFMSWKMMRRWWMN